MGVGVSERVSVEVDDFVGERVLEDVAVGVSIFVEVRVNVGVSVGPVPPNTKYLLALIQ